MSFSSRFLFLCPVSSAGPNITLEGQYHCYQGPAILLDRLCDFMRDCPLGDDEGDHCREYHCDADQPLACPSAFTPMDANIFASQPQWRSWMKRWHSAHLGQQLEISLALPKKVVLCLVAFLTPDIFHSFYFYVFASFHIYFLPLSKSKWNPSQRCWHSFQCEIPQALYVVLACVSSANLFSVLPACQYLCTIFERS